MLLLAYSVCKQRQIYHLENFYTMYMGRTKQDYEKVLVSHVFTVLLFIASLSVSLSLYIYIYIYTNLSAWAGCDPRSVLEVRVFLHHNQLSYHCKKENLPYYLLIVEGRIVGFMPFPTLLAEMWKSLSIIWIEFTVSIFYDSKHYTASTMYI